MDSRVDPGLPVWSWRVLLIYQHDLSRLPLHAAAFADHVDCVQLLLAHDAPVDAVDQSGRSALMMAAERGAIRALGMEQVPLMIWNRFSVGWMSDLNMNVWV